MGRQVFREATEFMPARLVTVTSLSWDANGDDMPDDTMNASPKRLYCCPECHQYFRNQGAMLLHIRDQHMEAKSCSF